MKLLLPASGDKLFLENYNSVFNIIKVNSEGIHIVSENFSFIDIPSEFINRILNGYYKFTKS